MKSKLERLMEPRLEEAAATLGWSIRRQVRFGRYTLDFLVEHNGIALCVELDGYAWHERDEDAALRDRVRDRWLLSTQGIPTVRFLGKEVMRNPLACVTEIVSCVARMRRRAG